MNRAAERLITSAQGCIARRAILRPEHSCTPRRSAFARGRVLMLAMALSALSACQTPGFSDGDLGRSSALSADAQVIEGVRIVPIVTASLRAAAAEPASDVVAALWSEPVVYEYRIGVGDSLAIMLWDHPELSDVIASPSDRPFSQSGGAGRTVTANGTIFFPLVGELRVDGRTVGELRELLTAKLASYIKNPQVDVRVVAYRSQRVVVTGAVHAPSVLTLNEMPLSIVDAIAQVGGAAPNADLTEVQWVRGGRSHSLDLTALLKQSVPAHALTMRAGDLVNVPDSDAKRVHVLGEIRQAGSYSMRKGRLSLADALGAAGGIDPASANPGRIYVFRRDQNDVAAHWLDASTPAAMVLAAEYELQPQDVVYVAAVPFTRYNRALAQLLPTLQALWQTAITSRELR